MVNTKTYSSSNYKFCNKNFFIFISSGNRVNRQIEKSTIFEILKCAPYNFMQNLSHCYQVLIYKINASNINYIILVLNFSKERKKKKELNGGDDKAIKLKRQNFQ